MSSQAYEAFREMVVGKLLDQMEQSLLTMECAAGVPENIERPELAPWEPLHKRIVEMRERIAELERENGILRVAGKHMEENRNKCVEILEDRIEAIKAEIERQIKLREDMWRESGLEAFWIERGVFKNLLAWIEAQDEEVGDE